MLSGAGADDRVGEALARLIEPHRKLGRVGERRAGQHARRNREAVAQRRQPLGARFELDDMALGRRRYRRRLDMLDTADAGDASAFLD
jgi:hypothetical protein